ncbi:MAG: trypsin-like peptidase domain-containing protein [Akkermansiaceae bacterium]|nr:trypsin-like peptidase domain-containing protein [Akkermansiaceae bacterium]NNM29289.1 trypsin-like peptidase domain-containing protein [Akkermansiaceae bacterium]
MSCRLPLLFILLATPAIGSEAAEQLVLATYKLANPSSTATGLAVRHARTGGEERTYLLTARHVFDQMEGDRFQLIDREDRPDGTYGRRERSVPLRAGGEPLWKTHSQHDLALLRLPDELEVEALPFAALAKAEELKRIHTGDSVRLAVFPERSEANGAGFSILRGGTIASYPLVPHRLHAIFLVDTTAWKGDSGGPVMHAKLTAPGDGPLVIGFVRGMRNITDTEKESRFVERKIDYPLGVSEVLHAVFARELIEKTAEED